MTNPYLERLRGQIQEKQNPSQPSKLSKPSSEGFEGDDRRHFLENHCHDEKSNTATRNLKSATTADPQNLQNPSPPTVPDGGVGCRVTIVELPQAARYRRVFGVLQARCPDHVPERRWQDCIRDGARFLAKFGLEAERLGWSSADLFALPPVPANPHPSFNRMARLDQQGLCWCLLGRRVTSITADMAEIQNPATGSVTRFNRRQVTATGG
jgi:hypothetical protein